MSKVKARLRFGAWPDARPTHEGQPGLSDAARRQADSVISELQSLGVSVLLDQTGQLKLRPPRRLSKEARLLLETRADQIQARLIERVTVAAK